MSDTVVPQPAAVWKSILTYVQSRINSQSYQTWLRPSRQSSQTNGPPVLFVEVPNSDFASWIPENYGPLIREALSSLELPFTDVRYIVPSKPAPPPPPAPVLSEALRVQQRKCPVIPAAAWYQWVKRYRDAVARTSEASDNFHYAGFLIAAGAALGRTVYTVMQRPIFPNLYLATIGVSGYAGKSGAMYYPLQLVKHSAPRVTLMHSIDSAEGLIKFMADKIAQDAKRKQSTILLTLDEMRWLIDKAGMKGLGGAMLAVLNKAYDSPSRLETNPKHGAAGIDDPPCLAIYGASTAEDFERFEASDMHAGLGRRFMYVPGERKSTPVPEPPPPDPELWADLKSRIKSAVEFWHDRGLTEIVRSAESAKIYSDWYRRWFARKHPDDLISVLDAGSRVHFRKVELIFAALDQSLTVEAEHSAAALEFTEFLYDSAQTIFRGYDRTQWAKQEQKLVDYVLASPKRQIFRRELQRKSHLDGSSFMKRLEAVAGRPGEAAWDGPLRQSDVGNGRFLVTPNYGYE
jgi:hypothetical protein